MESVENVCHDGDHFPRNNSDGNSDSEEGDLVLEFRDHKITQQYCLILKEYDGKGVFVMKLLDQENVVGLFEIVHTFKMKHLFRSIPITVRDIVSRYVADVSIYENSMNKMNLITGSGIHVSMRDPLIRVFQGGRLTTEVLYLQNKKYLRRKKNEAQKSDPDPQSDSYFTKSDMVGLPIAILLLIGVILVFCSVPLSSPRRE